MGLANVKISIVISNLFGMKYPSTVATLSRRAKDIISAAFQKAVPKENHTHIDGYDMKLGLCFTNGIIND